jgi:hypothetical protein
VSAVKSKNNTLPTELLHHKYYMHCIMVEGFLILLESKIAVPDITPEPKILYRHQDCPDFGAFSIQHFHQKAVGVCLQ